MGRPKVTVVIPCHNAEAHLRETLDSVRAQTMDDFDVVCVDNASNDGTRAILDEYVRFDNRFAVVKEPAPGEGMARDTGLSHATGEWLYFLDADDIMEPNLLERATARGTETGADVIIFRTALLDDRTGELSDADFAFQTDWLPDGPTSVYDPHEHPDRQLNSFQNWVHNKLFRTSFVRDNEIPMQRIHRTADLLFTCTALTEAHTVALLPERLHRYRIMSPTSAMMTSDAYPLDFYDAFLSLRERLEKDDTFALYRESFVNWVIEGVSANLEVARSWDGFSTIANRMRDGGLDELGIWNFPMESCDDPWRYDMMRLIADGTNGELAFAYARHAVARRDNATLEVSRGHMLLSDANERCNEARRDAERFERDVRMTQGELEDARRMLADCEQGYHTTLGELATTRDELEAARSTLRDCEAELRDTKGTLDATRHALDAVEGSRSFAIGRTVTLPARVIRDAIKGRFTSPAG